MMPARLCGFSQQYKLILQTVVTEFTVELEDDMRRRAALVDRDAHLGDVPHGAKYVLAGLGKRRWGAK